MNAARTNLGIATEYYQNFRTNALYFYGVNSQTFFKTYLSEFGFNKQLNKVSTKKISSKSTNENHERWCCNICGVNMESEYLLNFHVLLEHSESARSPVGVA